MIAGKRKFPGWRQSSAVKLRRSTVAWSPRFKNTWEKSMCNMGVYGGGTLRMLITALALASSTPLATAQTFVPDGFNVPMYGCPPMDITDWFLSRAITVNGMVNPPDNVNFPEKGDCNFYQWAEHMFLWVTSPPLPGYGEGPYVFDSPVFFEVSPPVGNQPPAVVARSFERPKVATVSISTRGPTGDLVVFDEQGKMYGLVQVEGGSNPVAEIKRDDSRSSKIEIGSVGVGPGGNPIFLDKSGKIIKGPRDEIPILRDINGDFIVFKLPGENTIKVNGQLFFLDQFGKAVAAGPGQADQDKHVLMIQKWWGTPDVKQLVYYLVQVNDVYAYFQKGKNDKKISATTFPMNQWELDAVKTYANIAFPDQEALIVELKSSWIELPNPRNYEDYVSINAQVPDFEIVSDTHWRRRGLRWTKLAMAGMHIAFSVKGHPELVWATFEHVSNAPNVLYSYWDKGGGARSIGPWLFSSGSNAGANLPNMMMQGNDITAINGRTIGPSDVLRLSPWGANPANLTITPNTEIISTNNNVQGQLKPGDVRRNYIFIGATWIANRTQEGSRFLANSTMETFQQPSNCLGCHDFNTDKLGGVDQHGNGTGLSHIFGVAKALPDR
jgi:hypothetical protein